jgi:hypothetical protein
LGDGRIALVLTAAIVVLVAFLTVTHRDVQHPGGKAAGTDPMGLAPVGHDG